MGGINKQREGVTRYSLITGESTYVSSTAQDPQTARRLKSLIPSLAGDLRREKPQPLFPATTTVALPSTIGFLHQFDKKDNNGAITSHFFCATATKLYKSDGTNWIEVTDVGALARFPQAVNINNLMHLSDESANWLFDGTNWVKDGIEIPLVAPQSDVSLRSPSAAAGTNWTNPTNVFFEDGNYAEYTAATKDFLKTTEYGFGTLVAPTGIRVVVKGHATDASDVNREISIALTKDGSAVAGAAKLTNLLPQDVDGTIDVGGEADLWGTTWTIAEINASTFGVIVTDDDFVSGGTIRIDSVEVQLLFNNTGRLTIITNRYYWTTWADDGSAAPERTHESSSSPISLGTGPITSGKIKVHQQPGVITTTLSSTAVVGIGTSFNSQHVGMKLYVNGLDFGTITSVTDTTNLDLTVVAPSTQTSQLHVIAPARATHWKIYASESENSKVGFFLADVAVTTMEYEDDSPFVGTIGSLFINLERPVRNDPTKASTILEVHKRRIFRRTPGRFINFFNFTAVEEVAEFQNGSLEESVPGVDDNTISDVVNQSSYPDESDLIRMMKHHGDALYIFTEDECIPLYGETSDDFALSDVLVFGVGAIGRYAGVSTPYGLAFMSNDRDVYLYPSQLPPQPGTEVTSSLIELGRAIRPTLRTVDPDDIDNVRLKYYQQEKWLIVSFRDTSAVYRTYIYDFEIQGWFEAQRGLTSLAIFEYAPGKIALVGGASDGFVYVIDDLQSTFTTAVDFPEGIYRTALMDFRRPDIKHLFHYLEYEVTNEDLDIEIRYWLDPSDVDNLDEGTEIFAEKEKIGANRFRAFPKNKEGTLCHRLLVEIKVLSDANDGRIQGLAVYADPVDNLSV